jgi:phosphomannomutase
MSEAKTNSAAIGAMFKTYDIRGTVPEPLNPEVAYKIGRALVLVLGVDQVAVGRDMRVSGPELAAALIDGIRDQGASVDNLGLVSTDALYFAVGKYGYPAGVMITASHNPKNYNGFKICREQARAVSFDEGIGQIRDLVLANHFPEPKNGKRGDLHERNVLDAYIDHALGLIDVSAVKPLKVAVDAGNGMAGEVIPRVFKRLPCELVPMYFELDGTFPHHLANPLLPENVADLQKKVVDENCDLGVAFDGDADRMFLIDEHGKAVGGDMVTAMVGLALLKKHPGATICYNLICSRSVPEVIEAAGGRAVRTPVGHSLIKKIMREEDAIFGGEHSGHFYFRDNWYADSGLIAMLTVLELISDAGKSLSEVIAPIDTRFRSGEINSHVTNAPEIMKQAAEEFAAKGATIDHLDGVTVSFPDRWFNLRASNTEPLLRLNVEAQTPEKLKHLTDEVLDLIRANGGTPAAE